MCELCGKPSENRICAECEELLEFVDASVLNRLLHSIEHKSRERRIKDPEDYYEDYS